MSVLSRLSSLACCIALGMAGVAYAQTEREEAGEPTVKVLVAYHSLTGNTEKMARGVAEGAESVPGTVVEVSLVGEVRAEQLFASDAIVVGSPVYWANMSGEVKSFFDNWQFKFGVYPEFKMQGWGCLHDGWTDIQRQRSDDVDHTRSHVRQSNDCSQ